ncbi:hypothetical protein G6F63_012672 [Rhizopus arrhizus]|uniref:Tc1-like transposase DDE domain-containing protein n=1 Tax=Rhizopus oryzae TaxID=64495 RepID=A0A9P7BL03_RHIOR|nr:hypothetical protein G6F24_006588 [Rhizopus arrhizus]KAG1300460.1 hypothetical protein G6F64_012680 [Rhizopus arrhizus]KAG1324232.1 hypothetical protein G6F63_012672 [Rhizopus arrhizus]KAG1391107.1 hypothetical protein G6F60_012723 [Rhizopus arrhizus]
MEIPTTISTARTMVNYSTASNGLSRFLVCSACRSVYTSGSLHSRSCGYVRFPNNPYRQAKPCANALFVGSSLKPVLEYPYSSITETLKKFFMRPSFEQQIELFCQLCGYNRFNSDKRAWAWLRSGESLKSHHVKMTVKHDGGSIMLWSTITYAGVGWMCKINGNMEKELYKEILEDELERTIEYGVSKLGFERHQVIFQHDNDPKHTSKVVKEYLQKQSYTVLQWPAQSPDLNPIENMWSLLKRRLNDYETAPKGMNELYERVTKVWYDLMKPEECQKVIESMPQRIYKCIQNKERWTDLSCFDMSIRYSLIILN